MGKIDDMRRQREEQHARDESAAKARAAGKPGAPAVVVVEAPVAVVEEEATIRVAPTPSLGRRKPVADEEGVCSVCGKLRPLQGGMVASHQKGLGKMCPGSRKPPA